MFTGLIETVQPLKSNLSSKEGRRITIPLGPLAEDAKLGDSICVNGVCLTINELTGELGVFDVMAETGRVSTVGQWKTLEPVNLERAITPQSRLGGHIVQGHVDGVGKVKQIDQGKGQFTIWIEAELELLDMMIPKGSVAVDGVSLTVVDVSEQQFSVSLIPTTLDETNLRRRKKNDLVNLEADIIGKWIKKRLDQVLPTGAKGSTLTAEKLRKQGFM
ncbi:MAG: riboflavin synthase [Planctomycetes bacterium]|nr:riboflavin synthase [Planctomycetota bacterium]